MINLTDDDDHNASETLRECGLNAEADYFIARIRALEAEAAALRAERDELRKALEWWLVLHDEDQNDADVLWTLAGDKEGQPWDHLRAIACDIEAARDIFAEALGSGGTEPGTLDRHSAVAMTGRPAPRATTPAPSGAKESDGDE